MMKGTFGQIDFIDVNQIIKNPELYYAHKDGKKKSVGNA